MPAAVVAAVVLAFAGAAKADPKVGGQLGIGGGARIPPGEARGGIFELVPRAEILFGDDDAAVGPGLELRIANFRTAELMPELVAAFSDGFFGGMLTGGVGYAWRDDDQNGVVLGATAGVGLVRMGGGWAASTVLYGAFRHAATGPSEDQLTFGLSFGGGVLGSMVAFVHD